MKLVEMDVQMKSTMINLYEKLGDANLTREFLNNEMYSVELGNIEKALRSGNSIHLGQCCCESHGEPERSSVCALEPKTIKCYRCLKKFVSQEKITDSEQEHVDYLGWGLPGLFEQPTSDDSSDSTSTDEDIKVERRLSTTRHKILRKLRRKKPEVFEVNILDSRTEEPEFHDPEIRRVSKRSRGQDDKDNDKQYISKSRQRVHAEKEYNIYGGGSYDFAHEIRLKEKYSSTKFDFLTGVIHCYQKYLKKHPEEQYPSVSELMLKSGQTACKDEEDVVARYYDVLYKKGSKKKVLGSIGYSGKNELEGSKDIISEPPSSHEQRVNSNKGDELVIPEDINRAKKTGILDLSGRSIIDIPLEVWTVGRELIEAKNSFMKKGFVSGQQKRNKSCKPLVYLNLSHNKISRFCPDETSLESLNHLCLTNNCIDNLPEEFGKLKSLQVLDLENNLLSCVPDSFCNLLSLKELNLRRNCLTELPTTFGNLKKLKSIDLRWNKLVKLPDTFEDLESLGNLNVAYNKLRSLPLDLSNLYKLIILDVSYNKLKQLPLLTEMPKLLLVNAMGNLIKEFPNFSNSKSLCEIRLDGNRIKDLETENLKNCPVVQLTLSHNKIIAIPDDFYTIETLVLLDCTNNRLSMIPCSIARLNYLTCLRVEENHIKNIEKDVIEAGSKKIIDKLLNNLLLYEGCDETIVRAKRELEVLYVKGETRNTTLFTRDMKIDPKEVAKTRSFIKKRYGLTSLPNEWIRIAQQYKVTLVDISKNKFRYIPAGLKILSTTLKELVIRENCIKTVPDFIGRMPQLNLLDLSYNCLDNLPLSLTTCHLAKLVCRRNLFVSIPKVVFMIQTIEYLDFSENLIKDIDIDGLRNLRKLTYLNLSKNEIKKLPSSLGYLVNLRQLDVTENLFKRPGPQIIRGGTQVILEYLKRHPDEFTII